MITDSSAALELRAVEQRQQLQNSVQDLKEAIRNKMDVKANAREYLVPASAVAFLFSLAAGYTLADMGMRAKRRMSRRNGFIEARTPYWV
jgi:tyrosyl-tRNA synthetase